ncbi:hypothetical protein CP978_03560 [Streptomyces nodosus]|uniref:Uncharacterized protein n=1 Tax=Streptomyces nodosus TaxID=40318 RepID=A0A5P2WF91_9ACTN|nr:hypothetical protein CP978_03560 [Streptomyces nodosus]
MAGFRSRKRVSLPRTRTECRTPLRQPRGATSPLRARPGSAC